jgi:hypothetical protein
MTNQALVTVNPEEFVLANAETTQNMLDAVRAMPGGFNGLMQYRIKIPAGGGKVFSIESLDGEQHLAKIPAIILTAWANQRAWNRHSLDESGGGAPDCASTNGVQGFGNRSESDTDEEPSWADCATCKWGQFGSGKGSSKACRDSSVLWIMRPECGLPQALNVPATSLKVLKDYQLKLLMARTEPFRVLTQIGLEQAESASGIKYSRLTLQRIGVVPPEMHAQAFEVATALKAALAERRPFVAGMRRDTSFDMND